MRTLEYVMHSGKGLWLRHFESLFCLFCNPPMRYKAEHFP